MSATLRAAVIIAVPTTVVSICGIYWLRRRKKNNIIVTSSSRRSSFARVIESSSAQPVAQDPGEKCDPSSNQRLSVCDNSEERVPSAVQNDAGDRVKQCPSESEEALQKCTEQSANILAASNNVESQQPADLPVCSSDYVNVLNCNQKPISVTLDAQSIRLDCDARSERSDKQADVCTRNELEASVEASLDISLSELSNDVFVDSRAVESVASSLQSEHLTDSVCQALETSCCQSISVCDGVVCEAGVAHDLSDVQRSCDGRESGYFANDDAILSACDVAVEKSVVLGEGGVSDDLIRCVVSEDDACREEEDEHHLSHHLWSTDCSTPVSSNGEANGDSLSMVSVDSGQGGSNGPPTPPDNRIDASPAGATVFYEFDFPTELCGMLIGRYGRHINGISRETGAIISVKPKLFATGVQSVSLQGSQQQVSDALDTIKSRFPISKFSGLTFEPSSASGDPLTGIQLTQITLPEGGVVDVIVSSVVSLDRVFVQQPAHPSFALLNYLNECMWACYSHQGNSAALSLPQPIHANTLCVAPMFGGWFRAQIVESFSETEQCLVRFVDYGGYSTFDTGILRQIRSDFTALPFQAVECYLQGVESSAEGKAMSSVEAKFYLESLVQSRPLLAEVAAYSADGTPFINLYQIISDEMYSVNEELIAAAAAARNTALQEDETSSSQLQQPVM